MKTPEAIPPGLFRDSCSTSRLPMLSFAKFRAPRAWHLQSVRSHPLAAAQRLAWTEHHVVTRRRVAKWRRTYGSLFELSA